MTFCVKVHHALAGEFLCVCLVLPIVSLCGSRQALQGEAPPSRDRQNTVRHLVQMMAIAEARWPGPRLHSRLEVGI